MMLLSVEQVLHLEIFRSCSLLAGHHALAEREVRWVSVIEVPVEEFIQPGELVLSTAMGIGHQPDLFVQFIRDVAAAGAAALAISIGPYIPHLPEAALQVAEEVGLPLIELPWHLRFSEIMQAVLQYLINEQQALLQQSFTVHQHFLQLILAGATFESLAHALVRQLECSVLIVDRAGKELASAGRAAEDLKTQAHEVIASPLLESTTPSLPPAHLFPDCNVTLSEVRTMGNLCGYLLIDLVKPTLTEIERLTLEHASTAAALCFLQHQVAQETEMRLRDDFVWALATGTITSAEYATARGLLLGYDVTRVYACVFGQLDMKENETGSDLADIARQIPRAATARGRQKSCSIMTTSIGGSIILFLEVKEPGESVDGFVEQVARQCMNMYPAVTISWGIGGIHTGFENFRQSYQEARSACQIGMSIRGLGSITHVREVAMYRLLLNISHVPESQLFWKPYIEPILSYEQAKGIEMMRTLEVYLGCQGNVSKAARHLHLRRQSLLYRLQRVEHLTGCSLSNNQDRFSLELASRLYRMWKVSDPR